MPHRRTLASLWLTALTVGAILMLAGSAGADVTGPCTATMNGADVNTIDTPGTALEVPHDGTVSIDVSSSGAITSHTVKLEPIGGLGFTADEGTDEGNGWSGTVNVADYAKYGVGIYKVTGSAAGPGACSGTAYVKVTGKSPLTTAAGAAGAGLAAVGAIGVGATAINLRSKVRHDARTFSQGAGSALSAFGLWLAFMVSGAGAPGASAAGPMRSGPAISVGGSIWSLLFGLGTLVLAQQFAIVYPTLIILIVWLVVCVLLGGLVLPSLIRFSAASGLGATAAGAAVAAPAAASTAAAAWTPTHRTPAGGLDAWSAPDPSSARRMRLDPGLELRVEQTSADWAQVSASNGWTGWVDARLLEPLG